MVAGKGTINIVSCAKSGTVLQQGPEKKEIADLASEQLKDERVRKALDTTHKTYRALIEGRFSRPEVLQLTENCIVIGGIAKTEDNQEIKVNLFRDDAKGKPTARVQLFPTNYEESEGHMDIEFKGTPVATMFEESLLDYLDKLLK